MILVDSSIWIDHLREASMVLQNLLDQKVTLIHPFVIGELAMGSLRDRQLVIEQLSELPTALIAEDHEVLAMVARHRIFSLGIGYLDAHLLASVQLTAGSKLWTRDRRLHAVADDIGLAAVLPTKFVQ